MRKKKVIILLIIPLVILAIFFILKKAQAPVIVSTSEAKVRDIEKTVSLSGVVESTKQVDLAFEVSGTVSHVNVNLNDFVEKGAVLAQLDTSNLYQIYLNKKALYEKAVWQKKAFEQTYEDDPNTSSINSDDIYWAKFYEYEKAIESAKAAMDESLINLNKAYLKSPISGNITKLNLKEGEYITYGKKVIQIADLNSLYFKVTANQEDVGQIKKDQPVTIELDTYPDETFKGKVFFVSESANVNLDGGKVFEVKISFENPDFSKLKIGMEGIANVVIQNKISRLSVKSSAVFNKNGDDYVYLVKGGKAFLTQVEVGVEGDDYVEIKKGLSEGDLVITDPLEKISHKKRVKIKK